MAKKKQNKNAQTNSVVTRSFHKGMMKDLDNSLIPEGGYKHARNLVNNSKEGDVGIVSNEPSNYNCIKILNSQGNPLIIIGAIHINNDRWAIYSTDGSESEIGIFDDSECRYERKINDPCLGFSKRYPILGVSKENFDCTWQVYWQDNNNPDRTMNIDNIPFIQDCEIIDDCEICNDTDKLDCEKIRLRRLRTQPCIKLELGENGGQLVNGSYQATIAYTINEQVVTDYSLLSNVQPIFFHEDSYGALDVVIEDVDESFDEFELVIISTINNASFAKRIGVYSTNTKRISIDLISQALITVPTILIPVITPYYEKSEGMYKYADALIRTSPTGRLDFNYQPLANQIETRWVETQYIEDYYNKGGYVTGYMRDEVYGFFIRWVYDTGDRSSSYHIPGRAPTNFSIPGTPINVFETNTINTGTLPYDEKIFEVYNTASTTNSGTTPFPYDDPTDGGVITKEGKMGYWESTERYPDDTPDVWGDLCGKPIRHHKMPDHYQTKHFVKDASGVDQDVFINTLGIAFNNIKAPVKNPNDPIADQIIIPGIIGYEILRSSRQGNKTVIAKGIINNMAEYDRYDINGDMIESGPKGLYQNYPYNDLRLDPYLSSKPNAITFQNNVPNAANTIQPQSNIAFGNNNFVNLSQSDWFPALGGSRYRKDILSFHSPDTTFKNPFLTQEILKIYGELDGETTGNFKVVNGHPKHKLLTNKAFVAAMVLGFGASLLEVLGDVKQSVQYPKMNISGPKGPDWLYTFASAAGTGGTLAGGDDLVNHWGLSASELNPLTSSLGRALLNTPLAGLSGQDNLLKGGEAYLNSLAGMIGQIVSPSGAPGINIIPGVDLARDTYENNSIKNKLNQTPGIDAGTTNIEYYPHGKTGLGGADLISSFFGVPIFTSYWGEATENIINVIKNFSRPQEYALNYISHCPYTNIESNASNEDPANYRYKIQRARYTKGNIQEFTKNHRINNLHRGSFVAIKTTEDTIPPVGLDNTRETIGSRKIRANNQFYNNEAGFNSRKLDREWESNSYVKYAALKTRLRNQYGQLDGMQQIPASYCVNKWEYQEETPQSTVTSSNIIFGGDIYISRYTEKNSMFFFNDWMDSRFPDFTEYDYRLKTNVPYPTYWMDTLQQDLGSFMSGVFNLFDSGGSGPSILPSNFMNLDEYTLTSSTFINWLVDLGDGFIQKNKYMYLFNSGVRDFYVESEVNCAHRDWNEEKAKRFYDPYEYTDLNLLFDTDIIAAGNFHKYDYSLSIARLYQEFTSFGTVQGSDYNPEIAKTCYTYYPKRLLYSLPVPLDSIYNKEDNWQVFLGKNFKDFTSKITAVKETSNSASIVLFDDDSPVLFDAQDAWKYSSDSLQDLTVGDGSVFRQPRQAVVNADDSYEFAACQNRRSIINTPAGTFWISQNQGKVFHYGGSKLTDISEQNMKWWFEEFLPYKVVEDFPDYDLLDNTIIGVGCQAMYDNSNNIVYFTKKDYKLKERYRVDSDGNPVSAVEYLGKNTFSYRGSRFQLGDETYFENASWTLSYDTKTKSWISFHDWQPSLMLPGRNNFMTTFDNGIWKHNDTSKSYCNFYDVDYPYEIDIVAPTGQTVNTLKSLEYQMECYKSDNLDIDKFHVLDYNFDRAYIYNTEQVSGELRLNLQSKNDPVANSQYPIINPTSIDILYSKEEQKYRFNQFWDITDNRGEFYDPSIPGFAQRPIWILENNGYVMNLNSVNLNYNKDEFQRKKFRHYTNIVKLRRNISGPISMRLRLLNLKNQYSPR